MTLDNEKRLTLMKRMRAEGIQDASIANVMEISRQRVGQLLGPRNDPPNLSNEQSIIDDVVALYRNGVKRREIVDALAERGVTESIVSHILLRLPSKVKHDVRKHRTEMRVRKQLADFFVDRKSARAVDLMRFDQYLYNSSRIKPFEAWCKEFGVEYEYRTRYGERT